MNKYIKKPIEVNAEIYKEGMEHDWIVYYTGNFYDYEKVFNTKQKCLDFINDEKGKEECNYEDLNHEIIYENPVSRIARKDIRNGDYIVKYNDGRIDVMRPEIFNEQFILVK